jgi:co-chaperonin GroES (HSP10)
MREIVLLPDRSVTSPLITVSDSAKKKYTPTIGTILQVGDGFHPAEYESEKDWGERCPFKVGDRVVWSKYEDFQVKMRVEPSWWEDKEMSAVIRHADGTVTEKLVPALEAMKIAKQEEKVEFVILDVHQIWGKSTAPRKEIWEDASSA